MLYSNLGGTTSNTFKIGKSGPSLKKSSATKLDVVDNTGALAGVDVKYLYVNGNTAFDANGAALKSLNSDKATKADNGLQAAQIVSIAVADWTGSAAPFSVVKTVAGVTPQSTIIASQSSDASMAEIEDWGTAGVRVTAQGEGNIVFSAVSSKPTLALNAAIIVLGAPPIVP